MSTPDLGKLRTILTEAQEAWEWHEGTDDAVAGWGYHMSQMLYRLPRDGQTEDMRTSILGLLGAHSALLDHIAILTAQRDRAERRHERLESGVEALARELLAFDCIDDLVPSDVDVPDDFEHGVRDSGHRLRTLLADTTDPRRTDAATTNGAHDA